MIHWYISVEISFHTKSNLEPVTEADSYVRVAMQYQQIWILRQTFEAPLQTDRRGDMVWDEAVDGRFTNLHLHP